MYQLINYLNRPHYLYKKLVSTFQGWLCALITLYRNDENVSASEMEYLILKLNGY